MPIYKDVFESNRQWVKNMTADQPDFFSELAKAQNPDFLFIGCSDSRVPTSTVMGLRPGKVFVHRNIANLVVNTDANGQSAIEYAVTHLSVKHVVVCGHYGCGGVKAAMIPADFGGLNGWLREVRDVYRHHRVELNAIEDEDARYRRLVELNVYEQCVNVTKTACVQKSYLQHGYPIVHSWVYSLEDGLLRDLHFPFEDALARIREIYRLDAAD